MISFMGLSSIVGPAILNMRHKVRGPVAPLMRCCWLLRCRIAWYVGCHYDAFGEGNIVGMAVRDHGVGWMVFLSIRAYILQGIGSNYARVVELDVLFG